ncbi:MAG: hypothetical protein ACJ786_24340 [Catenulispora sp.]
MWLGRNIGGMESERQGSTTLRIGVTGHLDLTAATQRAVVDALRRHLLGLGSPQDIVGVTCLARGADSLFAQVIIALGGRLEVIIPSVDYRQSQVTADHEAVFSEMLGRAARVYQMPARQASQEAYVAANQVLLESINELVAVWDGEADGPAGGTADVVRTARERAIPVAVVWPAGSERS